MNFLLIIHFISFLLKRFFNLNVLSLTKLLKEKLQKTYFLI